MKKNITTSLVTAIIVLLFSCNKQAAKDDATSVSENSKLKISEVVSISEK